MTTQVDDLPNYTKKEEIYNSISHFAGFLFGVGVTIYFFIYELVNKVSFVNMIPFYIYSLFMMMMFFVSGFYHSRKFYSRSRAIARKLDHSDIYLFIAATYTPICLVGIADLKVGIIALLIDVILNAIGMVLSLINVKKKLIDILAYFCYIIAGWWIVIIYPFNLGIPFFSFLWVLIGGIAYTIGAILYAIGKKKRYFHTVFHIFVLLGAIFQFVGVVSLLTF